MRIVPYILFVKGLTTLDKTLNAMAEFPKKYKHKDAEARFLDAWENHGVYYWDESQPREANFVIDTPPPTVSGTLHMGHVFSYAQADFVARYQRMKGKNVFYPMGFDDNGLPTERLVEKTKKIRAHTLPREEFIAVCEEISEEARTAYRALFNSIALSVDSRQEYHTISSASRKISQLSFLHLLENGAAYRKIQPMFWDPADRTAIAQAEAEEKEKPSHFSDIEFTVKETGEKLAIGTTRPELLAACGAVFFHPEDARYTHLEGKTAISPLFGVSVPLLADDLVKQDKGTGLVMCCTFGDETDMQWQRIHDLPLRVIIGRDGKITHLDGLGIAHPETNDVWPSVLDTGVLQERTQRLQGLTVNAARAESLKMLEESGQLIKSEAITHSVKCAERSGAPLEILPTEQWFLRITDKKDALKAKAAECKWHPAFMKTRVDQWIDGLSWDWCISRQRYFGVPFPIWYSLRPSEEGKILTASHDQLPVNPLVDLPEGYNADEVVPEKDVMDTWATSSISPQLNAKGIAPGYMVDEERYTKLFPADIRPQAHEIIRTWAFYTLAKAHLHSDTIPWKNLMISGWCLAADKTKMSKSKGNVVTPVELIHEKSADAVRYWASTSRLGADTAYSEDTIKIGSKLVNKLFNACKFVSLHIERVDGIPDSAAYLVKNGLITETADIWALDALRDTIEKASEAFERYEYCEARTHIEKFFWHIFCDNYLEYIKVRAYGEAEGITPEARMSAIYTVYHCVETVLRLFAPFLPFITEELYQILFADKTGAGFTSVHAQNMWPKASDFPQNTNASASGAAAVAVVEAVRKMKAERNVSIKTPLDILTITGDRSEPLLQGFTADIANASGAETLTFTAPDGAADRIVTVAAGDTGLTVSAVFTEAE